MADETKDPKTEPTALDAALAQIETLKGENFNMREERRTLKTEVETLTPQAAKYAEYEEANATETEKAAAVLAGYQEQIKSAELGLETAKRDASFNQWLNDLDIDPVHAEMLGMGKASMQFDDKAKMTELLSPYARKRNGVVAPVIAPAATSVPDMANMQNLSPNDRLAAYGAALEASKQ